MPRTPVVRREVARSTGTATAVLRTAAPALAAALAVLVVIHWPAGQPGAWTVWILGSNLVSSALYCYDKWSAQTGRRRVSEATLLSVAAIGGSIGAVVTMLLVRHKTSKRRFLSALVLIQLIQLIIALLVLRSG